MSTSVVVYYIVQAMVVPFHFSIFFATYLHVLVIIKQGTQILCVLFYIISLKGEINYLIHLRTLLNETIAQ